MKFDESWSPGEVDTAWIEDASAPLPPALARLEAAGLERRIPIVDRALGRLLAVLAANRRGIVEIGTAYGFSTLWMALAQPREGRIVTVDPSRSRTDLARGFWREAGVPDDRITVINEPALDALAAGHPALHGPFDLAFIDALKDECQGYLDGLLPRLSPGALVVVDNVLWSGRVSGARPIDGQEVDTLALREFNQRVLNDPRLAATILPMGDGVLLATVRP